MDTGTFLLLMLILCIAAMSLLGILYLRRRRLTPSARLMWILVALALPLVGAFLVITLRPGLPLESLERK